MGYVLWKGADWLWAFFGRRPTPNPERDPEETRVDENDSRYSSTVSPLTMDSPNPSLTMHLPYRFGVPTSQIDGRRPDPLPHHTREICTRGIPVTIQRINHPHTSLEEDTEEVSRLPVSCGEQLIDEEPSYKRGYMYPPSQYDPRR